jgi:hypothetical protein
VVGENFPLPPQLYHYSYKLLTAASLKAKSFFMIIGDICKEDHFLPAKTLKYDLLFATVYAMVNQDLCQLSNKLQRSLDSLLFIAYSYVLNLSA